MRPKLCWTFLHVSIVAALAVMSNTDSPESSDCIPEVLVRRNTVYEAPYGTELKINCTVVYCNNSSEIPSISWFKLEENIFAAASNNSHRVTKTEWTSVPSQRISYLIFHKIHHNDTGSYQCRCGGSIGHGINVSVYGNEEHINITPKTDTNNTNLDDGSTNIWMYVYPAAGIVSLVIIVIIISVVSMQGCKGKPKKESHTENQYVAVAMVNHPSPHAGLQASPRGSPATPLPRRSTRRKTPPSQPHESPSPRDNDHLYSATTRGRDRRRDKAEEGSLVYAALNHHVPAGAAARTRRQEEETSEYAAIRVKN